MKCSIVKKSMAVVLCVALLIATCFTASANELSIQAKLAPYQEIINKLNMEFGLGVQIPEGDEEEVYFNLINNYSSLEDFENRLRQALIKEVENRSKEEYSEEGYCENPSTGNIVSPYYVIDDWTQEKPVDVGSFLTLHTKVYSRSDGDQDTYTYQSVVKIGGYWWKHYGDFFFAFVEGTGSYKFNAARTSCAVTGQFVKRNDEGLILTGYYTRTYNFGILDDH